MDQCTHEVRKRNGKSIIEFCQRRPAGQSIKQWLDEIRGIVARINVSEPYMQERARKADEEEDAKCRAGLQKFSGDFVGNIGVAIS